MADPSSMDLVKSGRWTMAQFAESLYTPEQRAAARPAWRPEREVVEPEPRRGQGNLFA